MSRAPGHERSAWAVEAIELHAILARFQGATGQALDWRSLIVRERRGPNADLLRGAERHLSELKGMLAGLAFRAAELVYDAEQRAASSRRTARRRVARLHALSFNDATRGPLAWALEELDKP